jgi:hypothetical protein
MMSDGEATVVAVHVRVGADEQETLGQREVRGERIDLTGPRWLGIVRDVVADLTALDPAAAAGEGGNDPARNPGYPEFLGAWWAGGDVEEYRDFRVIHRTDPSISLASKTEAGARALRAAADKRGIYLP